MPFFTSERDDTAGGDSNGDGGATKPAPADWYWVKFSKSATQVHDAVFRYGGYDSYLGMVQALDCSPEFTSCRFEHSRAYGLYYEANPLLVFTLSNNTFTNCPGAVDLLNTNPTSKFTGNTITGSTGYPVRLKNGAMVIFENNTLSDTPNTVIEVSGDVGGNVTWPRIMFGNTYMPYLVYGKLQILSGATLTVDPNVVVKLAYQSGWIRFLGDLDLRGSFGNEVVFTSERDDKYGGDTNGDGDKTKPAAGDWSVIDFHQGLSRSLHDAVFRYGGYGPTPVAMIGIYGCSADVTSCRFQDAKAAGLYYDDAGSLNVFKISGNTFENCPVAVTLKNVNTESAFDGNTIKGCIGYPIELLDGAMLVFKDIIFSGTPNKVIKVTGEVTGHTTWSRVSLGTTSVPYLISGGLKVMASGTLTIEPDVVIKFKYQSSYFEVYGKLFLNGSLGKEVVFTSERDDTYGGDSNGDDDLTRPASNDWYYFYISGTTSPLHHVIFRYGGYGSGTYAMVWIDGSPDITYCRFEHASNYAVWYTGNDTIPSTLSDNTFYTFNAGLVLKSAHPDTIVKRNTITGCIKYPIRLVDGTTAVFQNNTITNSVHKVIAVSGSLISKKVTWKPVRFGETIMPYLIDGSLNVDSDSILTIDAEVVVKFAYQSSYLSVNGDIELLGSPGKEVVFTSERDDTYGGDSNGDEFRTRPVPGDWRWIVIRKSTFVFHDAIVRYGGYNVGTYGMVWVDGCSPDITSCRFEHAFEKALYYRADEKDPFVISDNTFHLCPVAMVLVNADTLSVVKGNTMKGTTGYPIQFLDGTLVSLQNNTFSNGYHKVIGVSGNIMKSQTWSPAFIGNQQVPYLVFGTLTVSTLTTLTIGPGVVVKFAYQEGYLVIRGDLALGGAPGNPIVFTSERDDEYGGDSNGDGRLTIPARSDWGRIALYNTETRFENALLRYGGYYNFGMLIVNQCSPTIRCCRFEHANHRAILYYPDPNRVSFPMLENLQVLDGSGISISDSASGLANVTVRNCHVNTDSGDALDLQNLNSRSVLVGLTIRGRNNGVSLTNAKPTIRNSIIHNCGVWGIQELDAASDPVLDHNCLFGSVNGEYYDHDTSAGLNTAATINTLNPPGTNSANVVADPFFVMGPHGNYYLGQKITGHGQDSPCVDHGNQPDPTEIQHGTTRTDHNQDTEKPDLGYHYAMEFDAEKYTVSVGKQDQVTMLLALGSKNAGTPYLIGCGVSGSSPGSNLGGLNVPLNIDMVTLSLLYLYGTPMFMDFTGFLDQRGIARPVFDTLGPLDPALKGTTLTMVAVLPFTYATNPINVQFQ